MYHTHLSLSHSHSLSLSLSLSCKCTHSDIDTHTSLAELEVAEHVLTTALLKRLISLNKAGPLQWLLLTLWNSETHLLSSLILKDPLLMY